MTEQMKLTKADRKRVWWRSQFLQGSWNYERMQNMGWAYALIPALKKLYTTKEDRAAALERHMEFFNTHPYVAAPIIGVTLALEEERANRSEEHTSELQSRQYLVCRLLLEKKKMQHNSAAQKRTAYPD